METGLTKNQILSELSRSPHGKLSEYVPIGQRAAEKEPEFMAHLIAWNHQKGQIRDSKIALPLVTLMVNSFPAELLDNSYAHLALANPRELLKGYRFAQTTKHGLERKLKKFTRKYLAKTEQDKKGWPYLAIQHRHTLKELYALSWTKPADWVDQILFKEKFPRGSIFEKVSQLKNMSPQEAAGTILQHRIPFLVASGAVGNKIKDPSVVLALINSMSPTELITNVKMLEQLGMKNNPALRGAFEKATEKASTSTKNVLKTTRAAEQIKDESLKKKLQGVQDRQLQSMAVEGNWLVLGDKSGSMAQAIEVSRYVAATLAKMVKGKVWLVFFNTTPQTMDVTGMTLDQIQLQTRFISASGGTSIGCGLERMLASKEEIDGVAIVSDGGDNTIPYFHDAYKKYTAWAGKEVPVYHYLVHGSDMNHLGGYCFQAHIDLQQFDLRKTGIDYYSLPNLVATMRTNRYSLIDEVMATPLLTLEEAFKSRRKEEAAHVA